MNNWYEILDDLLNGLQGLRDQLSRGRDWVNITREDADALDAALKELDKLRDKDKDA